MWCMQRTNIYLDDHQVVLLDEVARQQGVARSEIIRRLLDRGLHSSSSSVEADLEAITGSFGVLTDWAAPPRGDDGRQSHLDKLWQVNA